MAATETKTEMEKANNRIQTTLTQVVERLKSVLNTIKAGGEVRDPNLKEIGSVAALLGQLAERHPTARTKKEMSPAELVDYARGQIAKAMTEGDQASPRLAALQKVLSGAAELVKQTTGAAEETGNVAFEIEVYQEPGLTATPEEKETPVAQMPEAKAIDELLAKVEKLCGDLHKKGKPEKGEKPTDHAWPGDMNPLADKSGVQKSEGNDLSWGSDPTEVRRPAS